MLRNKPRRRFQPNSAKKRLFFSLLAFFIALSMPVYYLLHKVYSQLENENWNWQRNQAQQLVENIERTLIVQLKAEQTRPIAEYSFFNVLESPLLQATTVNLSPLSKLPPDSDIPSLVGYFQMQADGTLQIPALPELKQAQQSGLSSEALGQRIALKKRLAELLVQAKQPGRQNNTPGPTDEETELNDQLAKPTAPQQGNRFDDYFQRQGAMQVRQRAKDLDNAGIKNKSEQTLVENKRQGLSDKKFKALKIETSIWKNKQKENTTAQSKQDYSLDYRLSSRKETVKIPDQSIARDVLSQNRTLLADSPYRLGEQEGRISKKTASSLSRPEVQENQSYNEPIQVPVFSFETEVSPLQLLVLNEGYLCFFRYAWNKQSRTIQGFVVDDSFLKDLISPLFNRVNSFPLESVLIIYQGNVLQAFTKNTGNQALLLVQSPLFSPFQNLEVLVSSAGLGVISGQWLLDSISLALILLLLSGFVLIYRLGASQIEVSRQQRNFIAAVSHELKTPLTSIRMYSEMLRCNWVEDESRKRSYYDYMFFESERLSRLINNVLHLARMDNQQDEIKPVKLNVRHLMDQLENKILAQIEAADYHLNVLFPIDDNASIEIRVDQDAFFQIMINLVDNAIKFSRQSDKHVLDIGYRVHSGGKQIVFYVRDYGPGVDKQQMKKIFKLFYRAGDELTRTQPGTGIGLALVVQLADAMDARVDLINRKPGAEFQIKFKRG